MSDLNINLGLNIVNTNLTSTPTTVKEEEVTNENLFDNTESIGEFVSISQEAKATLNETAPEQNTVQTTTKETENVSTTTYKDLEDAKAEKNKADENVKKAQEKYEKAQKNLTAAKKELASLKSGSIIRYLLKLNVYNARIASLSKTKSNSKAELDKALAEQKKAEEKLNKAEEQYNEFVTNQTVTNDDPANNIFAIPAPIDFTFYTVDGEKVIPIEPVAPRSSEEIASTYTDKLTTLTTDFQKTFAACKTATQKTTEYTNFQKEATELLNSITKDSEGMNLDDKMALLTNVLSELNTPATKLSAKDRNAALSANYEAYNTALQTLTGEMLNDNTLSLADKSKKLDNFLTATNNAATQYQKLGYGVTAATINKVKEDVLAKYSENKTAISEQIIADPNISIEDKKELIKSCTNMLNYATTNLTSTTKTQNTQTAYNTGVDMLNKLAETIKNDQTMTTETKLAHLTDVLCEKVKMVKTASAVSTKIVGAAAGLTAIANEYNTAFEAIAKDAVANGAAPATLIKEAGNNLAQIYKTAVTSKFAAATIKTVAQKTGMEAINKLSFNTISASNDKTTTITNMEKTLEEVAKSYKKISGLSSATFAYKLTNTQIKELLNSDPKYAYDFALNSLSATERKLITSGKINIMEKLPDGSPKYVFVQGLYDKKYHIYKMTSATFGKSYLRVNLGNNKLYLTQTTNTSGMPVITPTKTSGIDETKISEAMDELVELYDDLLEENYHTAKPDRTTLEDVQKATITDFAYSKISKDQIATEIVSRLAKAGTNGQAILDEIEKKSYKGQKINNLINKLAQIITDSKVEQNTGSASSVKYKTQSPLSFDLDGNGITTTENKVKFDIDGDGVLDLINDSADAVLVFDADGNGIAGESGKEVFGNNTDLDGDGVKDGFANGFEALKALAKKENLIGDNDTQLSAKDIAILEAKYGLAVKVGYTGEAKSLSELGITAINLSTTSKTETTTNFDGRGNELMTQEGATFEINGKVNNYADVWHIKYDTKD